MDKFCCLDDTFSVDGDADAAVETRIGWNKDNDSVKKCIEYEVEGARPRGKPKKTWTEIVKRL